MNTLKSFLSFFSCSNSKRRITRGKKQKKAGVQSVIKCVVDEGVMHRLVFHLLITQISPI